MTASSFRELLMDVLRHFSAIGLEKSAGLVDASSVRCRDSRVNRVYALMNSHARAPTMDVLFSAQTFEQTAKRVAVGV